MILKSRKRKEQEKREAQVGLVLIALGTVGAGTIINNVKNGILEIMTTVKVKKEEVSEVVEEIKEDIIKE